MIPNARVLVLAAAFAFPATLDAQEVVAAVHVHGNTLTPTEEIVRAAGIVVGEPFSDEKLAEAEARLRKTLTFESLDVLKRYASISDLTQILVLIQVDEGPVQVDLPEIDVPTAKPRPTTVRRSRFNVMFVPILAGQDGYGFAYGAQFAISGHRSQTRRLVFPLSWGGDKRAAVEYQQEFAQTFVPRVRTGVMIQRRTHPYFDEDADRQRAWLRTEWPLGRHVRTGVELAWQSSTLLDEQVDARSVGADVTVDTRLDPLMPRNAIYIRAGVQALRYSGVSPLRSEVDANGYVGLVHGTVLALRVVREDFSRPAPEYYKSILGGSSNLRGLRAGYAIGDILTAGSAEVRVPLTSPLRAAHFGISAFMDAGTTYDDGQRLSDQKFSRGVGGGVWMTAPLFRASLMVGRGLGVSTRVHFAVGLTL